jgi:hypothetical protein
MTIIIVAGLLRIYSVSAQSLWWDEIVAISASRMAWGDIFYWAAHHEVHPPLFHCILKIIGFLCTSDVCYKSISLISGTACVYVSYRVAARLFSKEIGLISALVFSLLPIDIIFSRLVRPYALVVTLVFVCLYYQVSYERNGKKADLIKLSIVNGIIVLLQYIGFFLIVAQFAVIAKDTIGKGWKALARELACFAAYNVATCSLSLFFLYNTFFRSDQPIKQETFRLFFDKFLANVYSLMASDVLLFLLMLALFVVGVFYCLTKHRSVIATILLYAIVPSLIIFLLRFGPYFNPWHLFYLIPAIVLTSSAGVFFCIKKVRFSKISVVAVVLIASSVVYYRYSSFVYSDKSGVHYNNVHLDYKDGESFIQKQISCSNVVSILDDMTRVGLGYYIDKNEPFREEKFNSLAPEDKTAVVGVLAPYDLDHVYKMYPFFLGKMNDCLSDSFQDLRLYKKNVLRHPVVQVENVPCVFDFASNIDGAIANAYRMKGLVMLPNLDGLLSLSSSTGEGYVEYLFKNEKSFDVSTINIGINYLNKMTSGKVVVDCAFDEEGYRSLLVSQGVDGEERMAVDIFPEKKFSFFKVRISLKAGVRPIGYYGPRSDLVGVSLLTVAMCGRDSLECQRAGIAKMTIGSVGIDSLPQEIQSMENIKRVRADGSEIFSVDNEMNPGVIYVKIAYRQGKLRFFPRTIGKNAFVEIYSRDNFLMRFIGDDEKWSPAWGKLFVRNLGYSDDNQTMKIVLYGKNAQVWGMDGHLFAN